MCVRQCACVCVVVSVAGCESCGVVVTWRVYVLLVTIVRVCGVGNATLVSRAGVLCVCVRRPCDVLHPLCARACAVRA